MSDNNEKERRDDERRRRARGRGGASTTTRPGGVVSVNRRYQYISSRRDTRDRSDSPSTPNRPIILTKPSTDKVVKELSVDTSGHVITDPVDNSSSQNERPITLLHAREDASTFSGPSSPIGDVKQSYQILRSSGLTQPPDSNGRREPVPEMKGKTKLIDDLLQWSDMATEQLLIDQSDFLVVGVLGQHGSGKSSILSYLAGASPQDADKSYVFPPASRENIQTCMHTTVGVDMYVTPDRVIFLDTQPILSTSVLDNMLNIDKKYGTDYVSPENSIEIQSLQLATFLITVCHVVLVVEDWFTDLDLLSFINTAEMLKPATTTVHPDSSHSSAEHVDYYPHIVFIQNKSPAIYFTINTYRSMEMTLSKFFNNSNLKHSGSVNLAMADCLPRINTNNTRGTFNLFLLPCFKKESPEDPCQFHNGTNKRL